MDCPGCRVPLAEEMLDAHYGRTVRVDLCRPCGLLWFDDLESLALTPGATLRLFAVVAGRGERPRRPFAAAMACPRCRRRLLGTIDRQRQTRFSYWRCPAEHGRLIAFLDFLREKNFVRPLSSQELTDLRRKIRSVTCSGCGAPVDLAQTTVCSHCRAPLSLLDPDQVHKVVAALQEAEAKRQGVDPAWPLRLAMDRLHVDRVFEQIEGPAALAEDAGGEGLIETALAAVAGLLTPA